jgi:segregation and condensation protein B
MNLARVIEALFFSAQKPLSTKEIIDALHNAGAEDEFSPNEFANVRPAEVAAAIEQLKIEYIQHEHGFQLVEKADGWQLASDPKYAQWVRGLFPAPKPARLSSPALETLAIIGVLQTLMERGLVKISGRAEIPGRPLLYETTEFFLDHFGLRNLDELPNVEELRTRHLPVSPRPSVPAPDDQSATSATPASAPE